MSDAEEGSKGTQAAKSGTGGEADVRQKLREMERMMDDLQSARAGGRVIRLVVVVLLLLVVFFVGLRMYGIYRGIAKNRKAYQEEFITAIMPFLYEAREKLIQVGYDLMPVYQEAIRKDWAENGDEIVAALEKEGDKFVRNSADGLTKSLNTEVDALVKGYDKQFEDAFPQLKDEKSKDRVVEALQMAVTEATASLVEDYMTTTVDLMGAILDEAILFLPKGKQPALERTFGKLQQNLERQVTKIAEAN